jgi:hypothetical protein
MSLVMLCSSGSFPLPVAVTGMLIRHAGAAVILFAMTRRQWRLFGTFSLSGHHDDLAPEPAAAR